jgi:hypothetical protein
MLFTFSTVSPPGYQDYIETVYCLSIVSLLAMVCNIPKTRVELHTESCFNLTISPGDCKAGVVEKD